MPPGRAKRGPMASNPESRDSGFVSLRSTPRTDGDRIVSPRSQRRWRRVGKGALAPCPPSIPDCGLNGGHASLCPPSYAGESHVGGAKLLRGNENLILTVSPDSIGDLFGPLCRLLFAVGRSSEEPSAARSDRDTVHCVARHAVRCNDLLRHRAG